ncbi:MAG: LamG domain-containing protein [Phycisphaerae bacterium]|nr:LamG domain-containing protein [Phycisphaerae bacterium]
MIPTAQYPNRSLSILALAVTCLLAAANIAAADLNDGLVGYWSFDEGEGGTAYDYSGHGNHGTIQGASWTSGISASALYFDGDADYVDCGNGASLQFPGSVTVSVWVKTDAITESKQIVRKSVGNPGTTFFWLRPDSVLFGFYYDELGHCEITTTATVHVGEWAHIAAIFDDDGDMFSVYINGVGEAKIEQHARPAEMAHSLFVAKRDQPGHYNYFKGAIDEVRIYDRTLSEDEILDLYWSVTPDPQDDMTEGDQSNVSGTSKDPVNTATGSFFHQEIDLSIPSRGSPITFTRYYNSKAAASGQKAAKSKQAPQERKTPTSQPASTKDGERANSNAKKHDKSPAGKAQDQAAGSPQPRSKTKEDSK